MQDKTTGIIIILLSIVLLGSVFFVNVNDSFSFLADPQIGEGLGTLCSSSADCQDFCQDSMGRCNEYCQGNPSNPLCNIYSG